MRRMEILMEKAAEALDDCRDPFHTSFLVENKVTADECFDLSIGIAAAIRFTQGMLNIVDRKPRGVKGNNPPPTPPAGRG